MKNLKKNKNKTIGIPIILIPRSHIKKENIPLLDKPFLNKNRESQPLLTWTIKSDKYWLTKDLSSEFKKTGKLLPKIIPIIIKQNRKTKTFLLKTNNLFNLSINIT